MLQFRSRDSLMAYFLPAGGGQFFVLFMPSTDEMMPTNIMEGFTQSPLI